MERAGSVWWQTAVGGISGGIGGVVGGAVLGPQAGRMLSVMAVGRLVASGPVGGIVSGGVGGGLDAAASGENILAGVWGGAWRGGLGGTMGLPALGIARAFGRVNAPLRGANGASGWTTGKYGGSNKGAFRANAWPLEEVSAPRGTKLPTLTDIAKSVRGQERYATNHQKGEFVQSPRPLNIDELAEFQTRGFDEDGTNNLTWGRQISVHLNPLSVFRRWRLLNASYELYGTKRVQQIEFNKSPLAARRTMADITAVLRREVALLDLKDGRRVLRLGSEIAPRKAYGVDVSVAGAKKILAHTHPSGLLVPSGYLLESLYSSENDIGYLHGRQKSTFLIGPDGSMVGWDSTDGLWIPDDFGTRKLTAHWLRGRPFVED